MSSHYGNEGRESDKNHQTRKKHSGDAKPHVPTNAMRGNQSYLRDEQKNPAGKDGTVKMNEEARQFGMKDTRKIVRTSETDKDCQEYEDRREYKEEIIGAFSD